MEVLGQPLVRSFHSGLCLPPTSSSRGWVWEGTSGGEAMLTLYQAEWCPHSHRVRQRLTELGVDYVAKQVPPRREDRADLRRATGTDRVPVLVTEKGLPLEGSDAILRYLGARFEEPADASVHRANAREHVAMTAGRRS
jgi:glutathione S-transferase